MAEHTHAPKPKRKPVYHRRMRPAQKKAIELFTQQALSGQYKAIEETLLEAGYAPNSAAQISTVMAGIRPYIDPVVERLERHRERVMARMESTVEWADYKDLVRSLDITTKNIRLLSGKSTQNLAIGVERRQELDQLIDE